MKRSLLGFASAAGVFVALSAAQPPSRDADHVRVAEMANRAADLIDRKQFVQAQAVLHDALEIEPNDLTCLYDLTCAIAGSGDASGALTTLERASSAGFSDFARVRREPVLDRLRLLKRYADSFEPPDAAVHRAAGAHVSQLRSLLGADYTVVADEQSRMIFAVRERSENLREVERATLQLMSSESKLLFAYRPEQFVRVIVASQVDYARLESRVEVQGSYDDATRTVLVRRAGPELRHEITHALHAADQHARGQQHPVWLVEGLGVAFEDAAEPSDNWRLANVQAASRSESLIPLEKLVTLNRAGFSQRSDLAYGEAGSLIAYLNHKGMLNRFYENLVRDFSADPTGRRTLEAVTGMRLQEIESSWRDWVMHRVPPVRLMH